MRSRVFHPVRGCAGSFFSLKIGLWLRNRQQAQVTRNQLSSERGESWEPGPSRCGGRLRRKAPRLSFRLAAPLLGSQVSHQASDPAHGAERAESYPPHRQGPRRQATAGRGGPAGPLGRRARRAHAGLRAGFPFVPRVRRACAGGVWGHQNPTVCGSRPAA